MAAPYALPQGLSYIDAASAKLYEDNAGPEIAIEQHVNAPVGDTFDAWIKQLWFIPTSEETAPGSGRGFVGHERLIPSFGIKERIEAAGLPSDDNAPGAVATILYKISDFGATHLVDHIALVRFLPVGNGTDVVWTIKNTPAKDAAAPPPDSPDVKQMAARALALFAETFETAA